ncbi:Ubiquitin fusion degradation protein 1 [Smittium mucronatum]|uniref:Ubiquitin fusion degradation protein 1 n=1 Tax=Smittium mucronatum TaxID=133383 RepID=A0A1R0H6U1_9FUNG|nr:Ubiquitin fusion degradation protein 1 [Smittium mucronatum]
MLFSITNPATGKKTNAGVLEFTAEEGLVYLPEWVMQNLGLNFRDFVTIQNVSLSLGTFVKIQPQSADFLDISDHRAVLENALRKFSTLTEGDLFTISYNDKNYDILVLETKPSKEGISIVETDLQVDFEAPPGYVEPDYKSMAAGSTPRKPISDNLMSNQIDALISSSIAEEIPDVGVKLKPTSQSSKAKDPIISSKGNPSDLVKSVQDGEPVELDVPVGQLYFGFKIKAPIQKTDDDTPKFSGEGKSLKPRKKKK